VNKVNCNKVRVVTLCCIQSGWSSEPTLYLPLCRKIIRGSGQALIVVLSCTVSAIEVVVDKLF